MHTVSTSMANTPYARPRVRSFSGRPIRRFAPPTSASPELHTDSEKKAIAVSSDRNEPTIRPCTPKCAPEDTALLVPLIGPNKPIGARISAPTSTPSTIAQTPAWKERPNSTGNAPSTAVAKVLAPPKISRNRSLGLALRSWSGICSTPLVSILRILFSLFLLFMISSDHIG